jgi:hypothetical protein
MINSRTVFFVIKSAEYAENNPFFYLKWIRKGEQFEIEIQLPVGFNLIQL